MPLTLQAKLLRVLENHEICRLGSNEPIKVDMRILAATHRDLKKLVREEKFRADLLFRLDGWNIKLPPLREREGDVELLAQRFLARAAIGPDGPPRFHPAAWRVCAVPLAGQYPPAAEGRVSGPGAMSGRADHARGPRLWRTGRASPSNRLRCTT